MMGQYAVNLKGLRKRNTYTDLIVFLQDGQPTIKYPDRTAKRIANSLYMRQLVGPDFSDLLAQQEKQKILQMRDMLLRHQASKPGSPGIDEQQAMATREISAGGRSGRVSPMISLMSAPGSASGRSHRSVTGPGENDYTYRITEPGGLITSFQHHPSLSSSVGEATSHLQDHFDTDVDEKLGEITRAEQDNVESDQKNKQNITQKVENELLSTTDNIQKIMPSSAPAKASSSSAPPQPSSSSGIPKDVSEARGRSRSPGRGTMVALSPMHRGKTIEAQSSRSQVRTLADEPRQGEPVFSSRGRSPPRTTVEGGIRSSVRTQVIPSNNFATDYMETGHKIENYYEYWFNKIRSKDRLLKEFELRNIKDYDKSQTYKQLLAKLINHDRERDNIQGRIEVRKVGNGVILHMLYSK